MKPRGLLGLLAYALAALLVPAGAAAKAPAGIAVSSIRLDESNGFALELDAVRFKRRLVVGLAAQRETASASYDVTIKSSPGIHATFGSLGQVGLSFHRQKKVVERPERNCRWVIEAGVYRGKVSFVGEGGYVSVEETNPKGNILRLPDGFCGLGSFRPGLPPGLPRETVLAARVGGSREVNFRASRERSSRRTIHFDASTLERVEGMRIDRSVSIPGKPDQFTATDISRAAVSPPPPFSGSAVFSDPAGEPASWEGTLAVVLPGLTAVPLTGEGFTARLCPRLTLLETCLPRRQAPKLASLYGSGSHSQPLALARLSSLR